MPASILTLYFTNSQMALNLMGQDKDPALLEGDLIDEDVEQAKKLLLEGGESEIYDLGEVVPGHGVEVTSPLS